MHKIKIIAFYLPQYHEIPENNLWWGEGFTDWVNVRKAKPLFAGHYQPRLPINENYYDLAQPEVLPKQAALAKSFGIHGFCFYHYWFRGRKLLEKPLEMFLRDKNIDMPFCLSWANEPWSRTWSGRGDKVLISQDYGSIEDWTHHFSYLMPYFLDKRYIRINGKPMILVYRSEHIPPRLLDHWNTLAQKESLPGMYIVETLNSFQNKSYYIKSDALLEFEPMFTARFDYGLADKVTGYIQRLFGGPHCRVRDYNKIWSIILSRKPNNGNLQKQVIPGAFPDWDNTPRKHHRGAVYIGASPYRFETYLKKQLERANSVYHSEYLFINAWNEWAEGAYLEPDECYKDAYLQAVKNALKDYT